MTEPWNQFECEAITRDYFNMFRKEVVGERYNKTEHRHALQKLLDSRSDGSIEYKHQNISAILLEAGYPYIPGYKPAFNYQGLLKTVVLGHLNAQVAEINGLASSLSESVPTTEPEHEWRNVLDEAPERIHDYVEETASDYTPSMFNYSEIENRNRKLGASGEEFVLKYEKHRLVQAGRDELAKEVEWTAKEKGDGAGYDIRSFDEVRDIERFIEVKTTNSGKYQPFLITNNEVAFSVSRADRYCLYRVFNFRSHPKLYLLPGDIQKHVNLSPRLYRASF
jgi:hypothetical protein